LKQKQVRRSTRRDRRRCCEELAIQAEKAATNVDCRTVYKIIKELSNRAITAQNFVRAQDGELFTSHSEYLFYRRIQC
jgi:hypothetical protein